MITLPSLTAALRPSTLHGALQANEETAGVNSQCFEPGNPRYQALEENLEAQMGATKLPWRRL
jgi:hypothetical protein